MTTFSCTAVNSSGIGLKGKMSGLFYRTYTYVVEVIQLGLCKQCMHSATTKRVELLIFYIYVHNYKLIF